MGFFCYTCNKKVRGQPNNHPCTKQKFGDQANSRIYDKSGKGRHRIDRRSPGSRNNKTKVVDVRGEGTSVFVSNMPWASTWEDIRKIFEKDAPGVVHVDLIKYCDKSIRSTKSTGCAIVRYNAPETANNAVMIMNGYMLETRPLFVQILEGPIPGTRNNDSINIENRDLYNRFINGLPKIHREGAKENRSEQRLEASSENLRRVEGDSEVDWRRIEGELEATSIGLRLEASSEN
jgi:RNA recognition motif-containing protein